MGGTMPPDFGFVRWYLNSASDTYPLRSGSQRHSQVWWTLNPSNGTCRRVRC